MLGVNKAIVLGTLGRDPEVRNTNNGNIVTMSLATSEQWKDREGEKQERTEWHRVVIFNEALGEIAEKYLKKGSKVYIEGKLQTRKWQDQEGNDRYSTEIVLGPFNSVLSLVGDSGSNGNRDDRGGRNDDRGRRDSGRNERRDDRRDQRRQAPDDLDHDIPF